MDGSYKSNGKASCEGLIKDDASNFIYAFVRNLSSCEVLKAEFVAPNFVGLILKC